MQLLLHAYGNVLLLGHAHCQHHYRNFIRARMPLNVVKVVLVALKAIDGVKRRALE